MLQSGSETRRLRQPGTNPLPAELSASSLMKWLYESTRWIFPGCLDLVLVSLGTEAVVSVVSAECSPGWYGRNCEMPCKCKNGGLCDITTGMCHCPAGYIGADCGIGECPGQPEGTRARGR